MDLYADLKKIFKSIYVLTLSNRKDRQEHILSQLKQIGLKNKNEVNIIYGTPFPYNSLIIQAFNNSKAGRFTKPNEYDCARNHYSIVKQAYDAGYEYCLIMEDDLLLLDNQEIWNNYIKNIPNDFDILQFGGFTADPGIIKYLGSDKGYWLKHKDVGLWNASMYALSRKGMQFYLGFMDKFFWVADGPLYKAPINDKLVNTYMCTIPLAIQADKHIILSDIRNNDNDQIDYNNDNLFEKNKQLFTYLD